MANVTIAVNAPPPGERIIDPHEVELRGVVVTSVTFEREELLSSGPVRLEHARGTRHSLDGFLYLEQGLSIFVRVNAEVGLAHAHSNMEVPGARVQLELETVALATQGVA